MIRQGTITLTEEEGNFTDKDGEKRIDFLLPHFQDLGVKPGWKRVAAFYKVYPNGLKMDWKVEDVEVFKDA